MFKVEHPPIKVWEKKWGVKGGFKRREDAVKWIKTNLKGMAIQKIAKITKEEVASSGLGMDVVTRVKKKDKIIRKISEVIELTNTVK